MGKLNDTKIKALAVKDKLQKVADGGGLYLELRPPKTKTFRLAFRIKRDGQVKQRLYTIGQYPEVSLAQARKKALEIKELIKQGIDPVAFDKFGGQSSVSITFKAVAEEYVKFLTPKVSNKRIIMLNGLLKNYIYDRFASVDIASITRNDVLKFGLSLEKVNRKSVPDNALTLIKSIFEYAIDKGLMEHSPYSSSMKKHLQKYVAKSHPHVAIHEIPKLLADIEQTTSAPKVLIGLKLIILLFPRAAELRFAKWSHVDFEHETLFIPSLRMKGLKHIKDSGVLDRYIALSRQAVLLLRELHKITGHQEWLLPGNTKDGVISDGTMNRILNNLGYKYKQDVHGFRGLASTYLNEEYAEKDKIIELCLAHKNGDDVKMAYDHSKKLKLTREVWQIWGDYLESQGLAVPKEM